MYRNKGDKELAEANASLIVKAVNNHEALLEALKSFNRFKDYPEVKEAFKKYGMYNLASQAIANVETK